MSVNLVFLRCSAERPLCPGQPGKLALWAASWPQLGPISYCFMALERNTDLLVVFPSLCSLSL